MRCGVSMHDLSTISDLSDNLAWSPWRTADTPWEGGAHWEEGSLGRHGPLQCMEVPGAQRIIYGLWPYGRAGCLRDWDWDPLLGRGVWEADRAISPISPAWPCGIILLPLLVEIVVLAQAQVVAIADSELRLTHSRLGLSNVSLTHHAHSVARERRAPSSS